MKRSQFSTEVSYFTFFYLLIFAFSMLFGINVAYAEFKYSTPVGGSGGRAFNDSSQLPESVQVKGVSIRAGGYIDAIGIVLQGNNSIWHGGGGGNLHNFMLRSGEHITSVSGYYGKYIDSINICTNLGRCSGRLGGSGGTKRYSFSAPKGHEVAGFTGRSGGYIDALGAIFRPINSSKAGELIYRAPAGGLYGEKLVEVMTDRCSGDVIIVSRYDDGIKSRSALYLKRDSTESTQLSQKLTVDRRRIRWYCHSESATAWLDPGTWRLKDGAILGMKCDYSSGGASSCTPSSTDSRSGSTSWPLTTSSIDGWYPERSRCNNNPSYIRAKLGPGRLLQINCYR